MTLQIYNAMVTMIMAKFMLNDVPHAAGLFKEGSIRYSESEDKINSAILGSIDAYDNGRRIGYVIYDIVPRESHIAELYVEHDYRHLGVGKELVRMAERNIKVHGEKVVYVEYDRPALAFWERLGYRQVSGSLFKDLTPLGELK